MATQAHNEAVKQLLRPATGGLFPSKVWLALCSAGRSDRFDSAVSQRGDVAQLIGQADSTETLATSPKARGEAS